MSNIVKGLTPVKKADFTIHYQNNLTINDLGKGIYVYAPSRGGSDGITSLYKTSPTAPYQITICMERIIFSKMYTHCAVGWRNSSSAKIQEVGYYNWSVAEIQLRYGYIRGNNYNSYTSWNSEILSGSMIGLFEWWRVKDDNTNRYWYVSLDGQNWTLVLTIARTNFIGTPDQVGIFINPSDGIISTIIKSWKVDYSS